MSYFSLGGGNEDSGDFMPSGPASAPRSNLNSLFNLSEQMMQTPDANQSLTYKAPKPPGKASGNQQPPASGVAIAVAVTAFRLENNQYVNKGKLGAALLRNADAKDFKILMYVTKQKPVATCQLNGNFTFAVQANNYASFRDDQKQAWSVLFENAEKLKNFAKQVTIAKYFSHPSTPDCAVAQDLSAKSDSLTVKSGDSLEVKYTGWLVNGDGTIGATFDSNHGTDKTFRFKSGKNKVIKGWESGMMGMQEGSKRFLVIPPALAYGQKQVGSKIPANSTLAFEVDLLRVKHARDTSSVKSSESMESLPQSGAADQTQASQQPVANTVPNLQDLPNVTNDDFNGSANDHSQVDESVRGRTASLNEQFSQLSSQDGKHELLSRMARMGHSMLPPQQQPHQVLPPDTAASHAHPIQARNEERQNPPPPTAATSLMSSQQQQQAPHYPQAYSSAVMPPPRPATPTYYAAQQPHHLPNVLPQQLAHSLPYQPSHQQTYIDVHQGALPSVLPQVSAPDLSQQYSAYPSLRQAQHFPPGHGQIAGSEFLPALLTESRQQSSEIRLLQDKVDKVAGLVEEVKKTTSTNDVSQLTASQTVDASLIMHNIQRIMQENERMKDKLLEKNKQIEAQNEKIGDLLQQNQKHVEKSNMILEQRNDSFKESFHQSQARSLQLEQDKVELTQKLSDATAKVSELTMGVSEAKQREIDLRQKFKDVYMQEKQRANDAEEKAEELQEELSSLQQSDSTRNEAEAKLKSEVEGLQQQLSTLTHTTAEKVKGLEKQVESLEANKREAEATLDEMRSQHQSQLNALGQNTKEETSKVAALMTKVEELEKELENLRIQLQEVDEAKESAENKLQVAVERFGKLRSLFEEERAKLAEAAEAQEDLDEFKERYGKLRSQATAMKQRYEERIAELESKVEGLEESSGAADPDDLAAQVKKIMNSIFQSVRSSISTDEEYGGTEVLQLIMRIIKSTTLDLLSGKNKATAGDEDADDDAADDPGSEAESADDVGDDPAAEDPTPSVDTVGSEGVSVAKERVDDDGNMNEGGAGKDEPGNTNDVSQGMKPETDQTVEQVPSDKAADVRGPSDGTVSLTEPPLSPPAPPESDSDEEPTRTSPTPDPSPDKEVEEENLQASSAPTSGEKRKEVPSTDDDLRGATEAELAESHEGEQVQSVDVKETESSQGAGAVDAVTLTTHGGDGKATSTEQTLTDAIFNQIKSEQENAEPQSLSRSASYVNEEREPPPLFDDGDDDDDNLDWLSK